MDKLIIGNRIKERRLSLGLTQQATGIPSGQLSDIEHGKKLPSAPTLYILSQALSCTTDWILTGDSIKSENFILNKTTLTVEEQEWIEILKQLPITERRELIGYARGYVAAINKQPPAKPNKNMGKSSHSLHDNDGYETA